MYGRHRESLSVFFFNSSQPRPRLRLDSSLWWRRRWARVASRRRALREHIAEEERTLATIRAERQRLETELAEAEESFRAVGLDHASATPSPQLGSGELEALCDRLRCRSPPGEL